MKSLKKHLLRKPSPIHGHGLFTTINIRKGAFIGNCRIQKIKKPNDHALWCEDGFYEVLCKLKYINHSPNPNVVYYDDFTVYALQDIRAGVELTHYYSDEM